MSKQSRPGDLKRHLAQQPPARDFCAGCGYSFAVNGVHRADCTAKKPRS